MKFINIAREYSEFPVGRYYEDGPETGQEFRDKFLVEPLRAGMPLTIELSGGDGYGSSFLDEAFGGIVRLLKLTPEQAERLLTFVADDEEDETFITEIKGYIADACADVARGK